MLDISKIPCWYHAQVRYDYPWNLRKSDGRNAIFLALHFGIRIDPSSRSLSARYIFALPSSTYIDHHFPCVLFALHSLVYAIPPYYLPHVCQNFVGPSPVTRFLYFRDVHRDAREIARASEATWDYEMPKFPRLICVTSARNEKLPRGTRRRRSAEFRITIFAFYTFLPHVTLRRFRFRVYERVSLEFLRLLSDLRHECFSVNIR